MLKVTKKGNTCKVKADGELTIYEVKDAAATLLNTIAPERKVELELGGVTEVDTSGVQLLLLAQRQAHAVGATLHIRNHSDAVEETLELLELGPQFDDAIIQSEAPVNC